MTPCMKYLCSVCYKCNCRNCSKKFLQKVKYYVLKICALIVNPIQDGHFWGWSRMEGGKRPLPLPKICHTYPTVMKLGTVIPYLKKIQKIFESRDTPPDFCWHKHFFSVNKQILSYQEMRISIAF